MSSITDFPSALKQVQSGTSPEDAAATLLSAFKPEEKLTLLDGDTPFWVGFHEMLTQGYNRRPYVHGALPRLSIPGYRFTDGPRGVVMGGATCFPVSMARGATWDVELEERIGEAIGKEGRVLGANFFGGVCVNLPRHPAWGRVQETYSEDPILLGMMNESSVETSGVEDVLTCAR
jgi:beta-glucosidase